MKVLVTGAAGFVGEALCVALLERGDAVRGHVRSEAAARALAARPGLGALERAPESDLTPESDLRPLVEGMDAVVHLAARVHVMNDAVADPLPAHRRANAAVTEALARAAARAGVRRFVFASTIKVNGEETDGRPFTERDLPAPRDPYGVSKWEAEQALGRVAQESGLEVTIVRPPLVYGPGVRANFLQLLRFVDRGLPLPLGWIRNARSLVFRGNLVDALATCVSHPAAAGELFLVDDADPVSTPELVRRIARALGRPARLVPVPVGILRALGAIAGRSAVIERLAGSLVVDSSKIRGALGWTPPHTMAAGLKETARWYRTEARG